LVQLQAEIAREQAGDHRLARAGWAAEQRRDAGPARELGAEAPRLEHAVGVSYARAERPDLVERLRGQHQLVPALVGRDPHREAAHALGDVVAHAQHELIGGELARRVRVGRAFLRRGAVAREQPRGTNGGADASGTEPMAHRQRLALLGAHRRGEVTERVIPQRAARGRRGHR